jgi:K+-transporting ATPase ATPase C chain
MYWEQLKTSIRALVVLSALTGLLYPLVMTGAAQVLFPRQANASLILKEGKPVGSRLIGQPFDDPMYFWSRLSATSPAPYNASNSSGSNLGPLNPALFKAVSDRIAALRKTDQDNQAPVPVDLVTSSASGLDPHISLAAAYYQASRVARLQGLPEADVRRLIEQNTQKRFLGMLGEPAVNVLELNLALKALGKG